MRNCPFCSIEPGRVVHKAETVIALSDGFPVSRGHVLIVPRRHVARWSESTRDEKYALTDAIDAVKALIDERHAPAGYNVGCNDGRAAGQTVMHLHIHVIPRYDGDAADPRGGVRWVLPRNASYWCPDGE